MGWVHPQFMNFLNPPSNQMPPWSTYHHLKMKLPPLKNDPHPIYWKIEPPSKKWFLEKIQILKTIVNICVSFINQNLKLQDSLWFTFILADRGPLAQQKNNIFHSTHHYTSNDIFAFLGSSPPHDPPCSVHLWETRSVELIRCQNNFDAFVKSGVYSTFSFTSVFSSWSVLSQTSELNYLTQEITTFGLKRTLMMQIKNVLLMF